MPDALTGTVPADWELTTLGEVCVRGGGDIQTGPFGSQLHASDYVSVGIPSIMPQNIGDNRIVADGIARISEADARRLERYLVRPGDIVYSRRGDVERRALVRDEQDGWLCGTGCLRVRLGEGIVEPAFAAYYLAHPAVRAWIVQHAVGATMPNLNTAIISAVPFALPPLPEQRHIARVLGILDDKIELNRRMSHTLESIARAIFKSWFVDFDPVRKKMEGKAGGELGLPPSLAALFPDQLDPSTDAPEVWPVTPLGQLVTASRRIVSPAEIADEVIDHYSIPAFDDGRMPTVEEGSAIKSNKFLVEDGIILVSRLNPRIPRVWFPRPRGRRCVCSTEYLVLSPEPQVTPEFIYGLLCSESFGDELASRVTGTSGSHQRVKPGDALSIQVVLPPPPAIEQFSEVTAPLLRRAGHCLDESERLASVRDAILPRLLEGSFWRHDGRVSRGEVAP